MCPECGSNNVVVNQYDHGVCPETGYHDAGERFRCLQCGATGDVSDVMQEPNARLQPDSVITPFSACLNLTPTQAYNLLVADMFERMPSAVIESTEGQRVIRYFHDKLTAPVRNWMESSTQV